MLKTNVTFIHQHSPFLKIKMLKISPTLHDIEMKGIIGLCNRNMQTFTRKPFKL